MSARELWQRVVAQLRASPRKSVLLAVLAAALTIVFARQISRGPAAVEAKVAAEASVQAEAATPEPSLARLPLPDLARTAARNPFDVDWELFTRSTGDGEEQADADADEGTAQERSWSLDLTLTGVAGDRQSSAVINGRQVGVGDWIEGATVESITAGEVVLSTPQWGRLVLRMD